MSRRGTRDAQILASQKSQSAETARQNSIVTGNVVKEREAQQAEPRIQDAPGPGSQPLAGDPAVQPAQSGDVPRIQDAPGPAQTLPKAPPAQTAPQPDQDGASELDSAPASASGGWQLQLLGGLRFSVRTAGSAWPA